MDRSSRSFVELKPNSFNPNPQSISIPFYTAGILVSTPEAFMAFDQAVTGYQTPKKTKHLELSKEIKMTQSLTTMSDEMCDDTPFSLRISRIRL